MFGARVPETAAHGAPAPARKRKAAEGQPPKRRGGAPTHSSSSEGSNPGTRAELADAPVLIGRGSDAGSSSTTTTSRRGTPGSAASGDRGSVEDLGSTNSSCIGTGVTQPTTITLGTQAGIGR